MPDITNLASNTTPNAKVNEVKIEIPGMINSATNASYNAKTNEVKGQILGITNLGTTTAFTTVENKVPNFSDLVKKKKIIMQIYQKWKKIFQSFLL